MRISPYLYAAKDKLFNHGIRLYHGKSFYRFIRRQLSPHSGETEINTALHRKSSYARTARMVDEGIEFFLDQKLFSPKKFLAVIDPYRFAPLTALLIFNTEMSCRVRVTVQDSHGYRYESEEGTRHRIPVLKLRAGVKNKILLEVIHETEIIYTRTFFLRTCPLPDMIENMIQVKLHKETSASPLTFVYGGDTKFPYAFDDHGEIRYYLSQRPKAYGLFPLSGGRFLFLVKNICNPSFSNPHAVLAYEMDLLGRVYREYYVPDGIHHDGCEMFPGGNLLTISSSLEQYVEDAVIEIDRETGRIVKKLCLEHILSDHPYFDYFDWAHLNTVSWLPEEHAILLCARNLHSVLKIDWETDELLWIFCDTTFWAGTPYGEKVLTPADGMPFPYQAHAAYFLPERTADGNRQLIIFDNHWQARRPIDSFDGDKSSHTRIYEIDERAFTVRLTEDYSHPKTKIRSNSIVRGNRLLAMCGFLNKKIDDHAGIIIEYDRTSGKTVNRFLTYNTFYRAYPFFADEHQLSLPMNMQGEPVLFSRQTLESCPAPDFTKALCLPNRPKREKEGAQRRKSDKFERIKAYHQGHEEPDTEQDLAEMEFEFYDQLLLVGCRDHLLEYIYLAGSEHCYRRDYTDTVQKSPALFENSAYYLSIPVGDLPADTYDIYVQCNGQIYNTKQSFSLQS